MNTEGAIEHELSIRVVGILSKAELVPGKLNKCTPDKVANLCQRVELVGLGSEVFKAAVSNTRPILEMLTRYFGAQRVSEWNIGQENGQYHLNCTCLYLTRTGDGVDDAELQEIAFGRGVDPLGEFRKFRSAGLIHTAQNQVKYFRRSTAADGKHTLYEAFPANFRKGDIVEVQGSVLSFSSKHKAIKTIFQMNALTLLNSKYSKEAERRRSLEPKTARMRSTLKRKQVFAEEDAEVGKTRRKFKDLHIEEDSGDMRVA
ncbi:hypothetical protein R3P38DRAFT_3200159 [Favolaschia claudopus]|uniref:Uncharacterized protein n=1 Tax=Favolaschia claudopus TaxID=2862362 RepID=A0AAW0ALP1_9AGAR